MTSTHASRWFFAHAWSLAPGERLHREALAAGHAGDFTGAARLYAKAARAYRRDLRVKALARLRVHELIARWHGGEQREAIALEIERRLTRLDEIESPAPPFDLVPAHSLVAAWRRTPAGTGPHTVPHHAA